MRHFIGNDMLCYSIELGWAIAGCYQLAWLVSLDLGSIPSSSFRTLGSGHIHVLLLAAMYLECCHASPWKRWMS
jgi:hypothetical protein